MLTILAATCLAATSPADLLNANRAAMGARSSGTIVSVYRFKSEGMEGSASSAVDIASGRYAEHRQAGLSIVGEGFDGTTPWMEDWSRFYTSQTGGDKPALAINQAYRNANAWWRADRGGAIIKPIDCNSIEVKPAGGQPFQASFDPKTHLLSKVHERYTFGSLRDESYSDYRSCGATLVPRRVDVVVDDDSSNSGASELEHCAITRPRSRAAFAMPQVQPQDWSLPAAHRATVAMRAHDTEVMIQVRINGKGPYLFYLDTGAHNILSPRLARELGIKIEGAGRSGGAGESTVEAGYAKVATIDIGGAVMKNQTVHVVETSPPDMAGELIGGIIGAQFLERFVTSIDYEKNTVTFSDPRNFSVAARQAAGTAVPFKFYDQMPQVTGAFDGEPALYDIDTGSGQFVTMTRPFVERVGLAARYPKAITIVDGYGTGGLTHSTVVRAKALRLGSVDVAGVPASLSTAQRGAFSDPAYGGNIGNGVLKNFRLTFDYSRETMYLARVAKPDLSAHGYSHTGLTLINDRGAAKVIDVAAETPAAESGLKVGDVVTSIGGVDVTRKTIQETRRLLRAAPMGQPIALTYTHDGRQETGVLTPRDLVPE